MNPTLLLIIIASMFTGASLTVACLWLIERRALSRPAARVEAARRLLNGGDR